MDRLDISKTRQELYTTVSNIGLLGSIATGVFDGVLGTDVEDGLKKNFGVYYYDNSIENQDIPAETWTTLEMDGKGPQTNIEFAPEGVGNILDPDSGKILLSKLSEGDELYIRHTVNITPYVAGTTFAFNHRIGDQADAFRVPTTQTAFLGSAGVPTGDFIISTQLFARGEDQIQEGVFPQIYASNNVRVHHTAMYISVTRR